MITVHLLTENRYLCGENVHNGKCISLPFHHYIYTQRYTLYERTRDNARARMKVETLASPQMLSCSLERQCLTQLALAFLVVRDVQVKGSHVLPRVTCQNQIHSRTHTRLYFRQFFFQSPSWIFSRFWKEESAGVNTFEEVRNFRKKKSKILITLYIGY